MNVEAINYFVHLLRNNVLQITESIGDFGDMRWELVGTTILSWIVVFFCLFKGIKSSGKVKSTFVRIKQNVQVGLQ